MAETDTVHPMTGRWARAVTLLVGVAAATGACSGSDGATPATPLESAEPITAPPSTDGEVSTTATTEPSAGTATSTSTIAATTTTEPAPTTTTLDDLRAEIEADLNEGEQALIAGGATPGDPASVESLRTYYSGPSLTALVSIYENLARSDHVLAPGAIESQNHVEGILSSSGGVATIRRCRIDAAIVVQSSEPTNIVNGDVVRYTSIDDVILDDGRWKLNGGDTLTEEAGETSCD